MDMGMLKEIIVMIALVSLIGAAAGIALDDFNDGLTDGTAADNITDNGLEGLMNSTSYLGTIGTIAGVAVLIAIVIGAFYFATKR